MLGEELEAASLRVAGDDIYLRVELDVGGIGFVEGLPGESRAEAAARLLDGVADWLPETERYWGRQFLRCPGDLSGQARSSTATQ